MQGTHFIAVHAQRHIRRASAFDIQQRLAAAPPHQTVIRQTLLTIQRIEVQPALAVIGPQPQLRLLLLAFHQSQGMYRLSRNVRHGKQQIHHLGPVFRAHITTEQQLDVVVFQLIYPLDGLADKGFHISGMLTDRLQQRLGSQFFRAVQHRCWTELRAWLILPGFRKTGGEHQPVVKILIAFGTTGRPGNLPIAFLHIDVHAIVIGDKAFVEGGIACSLGRHEHAHLDRLVGPGSETDLGVHHPHRVLLVLSQRHLLYQQLVSDTAAAQQQEKHGQNPCL